jgi:4-amino-4-deoxy-L-arabinose transferase-like glycosyltransferase
MRRTLPLIGIVALGLTLRLWHIGWGLPDIFEEATAFHRAWGFWHWGGPGFDWNPHFFNYPALAFYCHFIAQAILLGCGWATGAYSSLQAFRLAFDNDPTLFLVTARIVTVLFAGGTIVLTHAIARRVAGEGAAAIASMLVAVSPVHIEHSQFASVDVPTAFFVLLTVYAALRMAEGGSAPWTLRTGLAWGCAVATKYPAIFLLPGILVARAVRSPSWRESLRALAAPRFVAALAASALVFLILNPFAVLDFATLRAHVGFERVHAVTGHFGIPADGSSTKFYVLEMLPLALGWALVGAAVAASVRAVLVRDRGEFLVAAFVLSYLMPLCMTPLRADRYLLPVLPCVAILGSSAIVRAWWWSIGRLRRRFGSVRTVWTDLLAIAAALAVVTLLLLQPVIGVIRYHRSFLGPDTRTSAREWISASVLPGAVIAMGPLGIHADNRYIILPIPFLAVGFEDCAPFYDARWYEDLDMAAGSSFDQARFRQEPLRYADFLRYYYDSLDVRWSLVHEEEPGSMRRGPRIWLYTPPLSAQTRPFVDDLLGRLKGVTRSRVLHLFARNLGVVLRTRGLEAKADQVQEHVVAILRERGERDEAARLCDEVLTMRPGHPDFEGLRKALRE